MSNKCPDCGRPFADGLRAYKWGGKCGIQLPRTEHNDTTELELNCCTVALAGVREKLCASEAEVARLEALFQQTHNCHHSWVVEVARLRVHLSNLLAHCLSDGGHRELLVGTEAACKEAHIRVAIALAALGEVARLRQELANTESELRLFKADRADDALKLPG